MCWLSVQCLCKHNIAIPHPTKECIRPRNPRGCWIIRRGDPQTNSCLGCEEYHNPGPEQPSWKDVKRCHTDPTVDWSEVNHYDIITMDKARHKSCDTERLEFRRRLRWKAMISNGMVPGCSLNEQGAIINDPVEDDNDDEVREEYHEHERMEAIDTDEIHKMLLDPKPKEDNDHEEFGYKLERMPSRARLSDNFFTNGNKLDFDSIFQVSDNCDADSSGSDDSIEAVNGSDESINANASYESDKSGEGKPLLKLEEMFDQIEASKPFNPFTSIFLDDLPDWTPAPPTSPIGDPVKKPFIPSMPIKLEIKSQPDAIEASPQVTAESPPPTTTTIEPDGNNPSHRERIDKALSKMRRMQAAYFGASNAVAAPERPSTPTPMSTREESPEQNIDEKDADGDIILN
ncbi:hypothetical protein TWF718_005908 [Orbilia javanica]|uniref:Uncharacterized protein n=1 Tax=Orbilia javanica TaxID=47235 RepID=A0AAN8MQK2_9PEZI